MKHGKAFLAAWTQLTDAATRAQKKRLEALLSRAAKPLTDLDQLADLATGEELELLKELLAPSDLGGYDKHAARMAINQRSASRKARDIGPLPPVVAPQRRKRCEKSLLKFCETYFKSSMFPMEFGANHRKIFAMAQKRLLDGGQQAVAAPRGEGKTTILEAAVIWAVLNGHHDYVLMLQATQGMAQESLVRIRSELETNELLLEDFPEVCYPIRRLEGLGQKTAGQLLDNVPTKITWGDDLLVFPTVEGSKASGARFVARGITASLRGLVAYIKGVRRRPGVVVIDDFQDDESAASPDQCAKRLRTINKGVLGLAGPGEEISAFVLCTVIENGDAADTLLSRDIYPEWNGIRLQFMIGEPANHELWEQYNTLRLIAVMEKREPDEAWDLYRRHRGEMDAGFSVSWAGKVPARYLSPNHYAGEMRLARPAYFWSEMQNDPQDEVTSERFLRADDIAIKTLPYDRGQVPLDAQWVVVSIDVQLRGLYYMVQAFTPHFSSYVIEYGCFPEQKRQLWTAATMRPTLAETFKGLTEDAQVYMGLKTLTDQLCVKRWTRIDGVEMGLNLIGIDANWKGSTVKQFVRESQFGQVIYPVHSNFIGCNETPISEYKARAGERIGEEWIISKNLKSPVRFLRMDSNFWTTHAMRSLAATHPNPGATSLYGPIGTRHDFLARHLDAQLRKTESGRRTVDAWTLRPGETEDHWLDCLKIGRALGSVCGARTVAFAGQGVRRLPVVEG